MLRNTVSVRDDRNRTRNMAVYTWRLRPLSYGRHPLMLTQARAATVVFKNTTREGAIELKLEVHNSTCFFSNVFVIIRNRLRKRWCFFQTNVIAMIFCASRQYCILSLLLNSLFLFCIFSSISLLHSLHCFQVNGSTVFAHQPSTHNTFGRTQTGKPYTTHVPTPPKARAHMHTTPHVFDGCFCP